MSRFDHLPQDKSLTSLLKHISFDLNQWFPTWGQEDPPNGVLGGHGGPQNFVCVEIVRLLKLDITFIIKSKRQKENSLYGLKC